MKDVIIIYGSGCSKCAALAETTRVALIAIGSDAKVVKEDDLAKIAAAGIAQTPALALNGKVLFSGIAPDGEILKTLLEKRLSVARGDGVPAQRDCCECRCRVSKNPPKKSLRALIVWAVVLFVLLAAVHLWNRALKEADVPAIPADPVAEDLNG